MEEGVAGQEKCKSIFPTCGGSKHQSGNSLSGSPSPLPSGVSQVYICILSSMFD